MKISPLKSLFLCLLLLAPGLARAAESLVHDGDTWVCLGDSITAENIYPRILDRVFTHYHPDAKFTMINSGVAGDTSSDNPKKLEDRVLKYKPTIVSVMYGMNEAINVWHAGEPTGPAFDNYRKHMTYIARTLKAQGVTVLLMSPTLTDPTCGWTYFNLEGTRPFLKQCAAILQDIAEKEGVIYVPVQEEMEAFQEGLPPGTSLRSDGVHVSALGQYQMARSIWERAHFADKPGGPRAIAPVAPPVAAGPALTGRFLDPGANGLNLTVNAPQPITLTATWSIGDLRKQETLKLKAGDNPWTLAIPADHLPATNGKNDDLVIAFQAGDARSLYILDLCRTQVLHFTNGVIKGTVDSVKPRPEGTRVANWQLERFGKGLLFSGEVFASTIDSTSVWPFGRDGFNLMFDFRPTELFAGIGVDRADYQTLLNVYEKPFFAIGLRGWTGVNMGYAAFAGGAKTPTGYTSQLCIDENFGLHDPVNLDARDFVGMLVSVNTHEPNPAKPGTNAFSIVPGQPNDYGVNLYANNMMIIDLKNKLPGDSVFNVHLYPPAQGEN